MNTEVGVGKGVPHLVCSLPTTFLPFCLGLITCILTAPLWGGEGGVHMMKRSIMRKRTIPKDGKQACQACTHWTFWTRRKRGRQLPGWTGKEEVRDSCTKWHPLYLETQCDHTSCSTPPPPPRKPAMKVVSQIWKSLS